MVFDGYFNMVDEASCRRQGDWVGGEVKADWGNPPSAR